MADEPATEPAAEPGDRIDKLAEKVDKLWDLVTGKTDKPAQSIAPATQAEQAGSVADEVRAELAKLKDAEAAKQRDDDFASVKAKVEAIPERQPREYRKATNWMKWVGEQDR